MPYARRIDAAGHLAGMMKLSKDLSGSVGRWLQKLVGALGSAAGTLDGRRLADRRAGWGLAGTGWEVGWPRGPQELRT